MQNRPLADRLRPESLDDIVGQTHLFGKNGVVRKMLESGRVTNMIFFGPPGTVRPPRQISWQSSRAWRSTS